MASYYSASKPRKRELQLAPGDLRLVQAFLNTANLRASTDLLQDPGALAQWAVAEALLPAPTPLDESDLERVLAAREGLRAVLSVRKGKAAQFAAFNGATAETLLRPRLEPGKVSFEPVGHGIDFVLGKLWAAIVTAHAEGTWPRLKICASADCRTVFYDHAQNRSAKWCRPACGEAISARATRKRWR